jgi:hypothetical protein
MNLRLPLKAGNFWSSWDTISFSRRTLADEGNGHGILVGKPEGKRPLGSPRPRWEDNIKIDLRG